MANGLSGRSAIVTGAAQGYGLAIARRLARAGALVMLADADEDRLRLECATIEREGFAGRAVAFAGDLRDKLAMANLMAATLDAHDGIDVLVNAHRATIPAAPLDPEGLEAALALNVTRTLRLSQIAARRMAEMAETAEMAEAGPPRDRAIVNLTSTLSRRAPPNLLAYSVSCAALDQLTRALALALAPHGIRVNAVAIGERADEEEGAVGETEAADAAEVVLFLASSAARAITGQILDVDGGRLLADGGGARP